MKAILMQDDCAPDSLEYFEEKFREKIGEDFEQWKKSARRIIHDDDGYNSEYRKGDIRVIKDAGSPYWEVYNIKPSENPGFWAAEQERAHQSQAYFYNNYCRQPDGPIYTPEIFSQYQKQILEPDRIKYGPK